MKTIISGLILILGCVTFSSQAAKAEEPVPFIAKYHATYKGAGAVAVRELKKLNNNTFVFESDLKLKFIGATVSRIKERSQFEWQEVNEDSEAIESIEGKEDRESREVLKSIERLSPQNYQYTQSGLGSRNRSLEFDYASNIISANTEDKHRELSINGLIHDNLTSFLAIKHHLANGAQEFTLDIADKLEIETHRFLVTGEDSIQTKSGVFKTIRVKKIRSENSERETEFWFAKQLDYLLIKMQQKEPDGDSINLLLTEVKFNQTQ